MRDMINDAKEEASRYAIAASEIVVDEESHERLRQWEETSLPEHAAMKAEGPHLRREIDFIRNELEESKVELEAMQQDIEEFELKSSELRARLQGSEEELVQVLKEQRRATAATMELEAKVTEVEGQI